MSLTWFGVKTLFRCRAIGSPSATDKNYDPDIDLVEERVVLFRARHFDQAIKRAEVEARRYAREAHRNPYGQRVVTSYLGACDAFELFESPADGVEAFSTTVLVSSEASGRELVDRRLGPVERSPDPRRLKFLNRDFSGVGTASRKR